MKILNRSLKVFKTLYAGAVTITGEVTNLVTQVFPIVNVKNATVVTKTADYTIPVTDLNKIFNNTGDTGAQVLTLPSVALSKGKCLKIAVTAAYTISALPVSGQAINLNGSAVVTKYLLIAAVVGNYVDLYCDGSQWIVVGYTGVVTKEA